MAAAMEETPKAGTEIVAQTARAEMAAVQDDSVDGVMATQGTEVVYPTSTKPSKTTDLTPPQHSAIKRQGSLSSKSVKTKNSSNKDRDSVLKTFDWIASTFENSAQSVGDQSNLAMMMMKQMQQQKPQFQYFQHIQQLQLQKFEKSMQHQLAAMNHGQRKGQDVIESC